MGNNLASQALFKHGSVLINLDRQHVMTGQQIIGKVSY